MARAENGSPRSESGLKRVLVVDDDRELTGAIRETLEREGYTVRVVSDGVTALEHLRSHGADAVVLDVILPDIDGEKLCSFIRTDARLRHAIIVICSSLGARELALLPEVTGDAYVAKGTPHPTAADVLLALRRVGEPGKVDETGDLVLGYGRLGARRPLTRLITRLRRYQDIVGTLGEPLVELDSAVRVLSLNRAALTLIGRPEREVLGRPFLDVLDAEAGSAIEQAVAQFAISGRSLDVIRQRISGLDWEITLTGRFEGGRRLGALLVFRRARGVDPPGGAETATGDRADRCPASERPLLTEGRIQ